MERTPATHRTTADFADSVRRQAVALGQRIRAARVRRGLRREDLAERSGLSRTAIEAAEAGKLTTGLGTYLQALWAMGLGEEISLLADAGLDRDGLALELNTQTKRVRVQNRKLDNDF
jgi:transcriptional regulator with XRE-family HTH domain